MSAYAFVEAVVNRLWLFESLKPIDTTTWTDRASIKRYESLRARLSCQCRSAVRYTIDGLDWLVAFLTLDRNEDMPLAYIEWTRLRDLLMDTLEPMYNSPTEEDERAALQASIKLAQADPVSFWHTLWAWCLDPPYDTIPFLRAFCVSIGRNLIHTDPRQRSACMAGLDAVLHNKPALARELNTCFAPALLAFNVESRMRL